MSNYYRHLIIVFFAAMFLFSEAPVMGQDITVERLKLSTRSANELAPVVHDSVLYFISNRKTTLLATYVDQNEELLYRAFSASLNPDSSLNTPRHFPFYKEPGINYGPFTFSPNGTTVIATLNNPGRRNKERLTLYKSEHRAHSWSTFRWLKIDPVIPEEFSMVHPALSPDSQKLYFASDMEGGFGETDIYVSQRRPGGWSEPRNMGSKINTPGKELFPFVHASGLLFFTSNGHHPEDDMDILFVDPNRMEAIPEAMPEPVNSKYDDFSCFIFEDTRKGYFASNRLGQDDLFEFSSLTPSCEPQEVVEDNFCFTFFENGPYKADSLPIIYRWDFGDGHQAAGLETDHCFDGPGDYHIELNVIDTLTNETLFSVATYDLNLETTRQIYFDAPDTVKTDNIIHLKSSLQGFDIQDLNPIFHWDMGDGIHQIGETLSHFYRTKGKYRIVCSAKISDDETICFYRDIVVE